MTVSIINFINFRATFALLHKIELPLIDYNVVINSK